MLVVTDSHNQPHQAHLHSHVHHQQQQHHHHHHHHQQQSAGLASSSPSMAVVNVNLNNMINAKDSRWLQLEVCREFQRSKCSRSDSECKFAHPPANVEVQNGRVIACYDSIKVNKKIFFFFGVKTYFLRGSTFRGCKRSNCIRYPTCYLWKRSLFGLSSQWGITEPDDR